jgi:hypothetical protein
MRNPHGPTAAIGAYGESYAAFGYLALEGLFDCLQRDDPPSTLGEYWLAMQASMARGRIDPIMFWVLDQADGTNGQVPLAAQRPEHVEMWTLFGDPALRLPIEPSTLRLNVKGDVRPGGRITVAATVPKEFHQGTARIVVEPRILRLSSSVNEGSAPPGGPAIEPPLASAEAEVRRGQIECTVELPEEFDSTGGVIVRLRVSAGGRQRNGHHLIPASKR